MKTEPKAFASLSSGLLARKGAARPAMRPQGFGQVGAGLEDLGWNDMGFESPKPIETDEPSASAPVQPLRNPLAGLSPVPSPVHDQQAEIADRYTYGDDEEGEDESGDYVDDTAEPFDPESEDEGAISARLTPAPTAKRQAILPRDPEDEEDSLAVALDEDEEPFAIDEVAYAPAPVVAPKRAPTKRAAPGGKAKSAFTLRLDADRHLKLRLACAVDGRSAQQLVTEALDRLLETIPELNALAERAAKKPAG